MAFYHSRGHIVMRFRTEPVYGMTWIWTLHRANNKSKSPIDEDNIWVSLPPEALHSPRIH